MGIKDCMSSTWVPEGTKEKLKFWRDADGQPNYKGTFIGSSILMGIILSVAFSNDKQESTYYDSHPWLRDTAAGMSVLLTCVGVYYLFSFLGNKCLNEGQRRDYSELSTNADYGSIEGASGEKTLSSPPSSFLPWLGSTGMIAVTYMLMAILAANAFDHSTLTCSPSSNETNATVPEPTMMLQRWAGELTDTMPVHFVGYFIFSMMVAGLPVTGLQYACNKREKEQPGIDLSGGYGS